MKQAWLVVNAFLRGGSFFRMEEVFQAAAKKQGLSLRVYTNADFIGKDSLSNAPGAALFFDKDLRLARRLEQAGIRLFNSEKAIANCDDKTLTALLMEEAGLPQPETILCPMSFPAVGYTDLRFLDMVAQQLGFPMVAKEGRGSFGKQVYLAATMEELREIVLRSAGKELLFQRFISEAAGEDLRLYVVGDEVVAAIRRKNLAGDFRANIENGGKAFACTPTAEEKKLALAACAACGTDFAGVDLLKSRSGPLVCEVNSNAHFLGLMAVTGINPADAIMGLLRDAS